MRASPGRVPFVDAGEWTRTTEAELLPEPALTLDQLTAALRECGALGETTRVSALRVEEIGIFSTHLARLHVVYTGGVLAPATLVLKSSVAGRGDRLGERFANEIRFYRELASLVPARTPHYYGGGVDEATQDGFLLVEDLSEVGPTDWMSGPTDEHARLAVAAMARMHARWWGDVGGLDWISYFDDPSLSLSSQEIYDTTWPTWRDFLLELVPDFAPIGDGLVGCLAETRAAFGAPPTLLHADAHAENMPLISGEDGRPEVVLLDWAGPRLGAAGFDLGAFIAMSYPARRRPGVEAGLVAHHEEVLRAHGVEPQLDAWLAYRQGVLRRAASLIEIAGSWSSEHLDGLRMLFHRCGRAAVELGVEELIVPARDGR
jgi:hypothetical protein